MRTYRCRVSGHPLYLENTVCLGCGTPQAYSRAEREIVPVRPEGEREAGRDGGRGASYVDPQGTAWWPCADVALNGCTWLAPADGALCESCALTRTRPNDADLEGLGLYAETERAKRQLLVELDARGVRWVPRTEDPETGLCFDLLSSRAEDVVIGHADGVVTIDLAESDDAYREKVRMRLGEPYRTMLGHLRHETGHYVEGLHVLGDEERTRRVRALFGDDRADYQAEIDRHYAEGPPDGWEASYISEYATMHPYEDFAETFAHFLHISDTLETALEQGLLPAGTDLSGPFGRVVVDVWVPLSIALNQVERSMGKPDLYPFVLAAPVVDKLDLVAELVTS